MSTSILEKPPLTVFLILQKSGAITSANKAFMNVTLLSIPNLSYLIIFSHTDYKIFDSFCKSKFVIDGFCWIFKRNHSNFSICIHFLDMYQEVNINFVFTYLRWGWMIVISNCNLLKYVVSYP